MSIFVSNLSSNLDEFVALKNSLGIEYKTGKFYLRKLDNYNLEHGNSMTLTKEIAEGWAIQHANKSTTNDRSWIPPIREFGRYLRSIGDNDAYILDNRFTIQRYHADVYLMTEAEIQAFFKECDSFVLRHKALGRPYVYPAFYRFLYCCGVRCAEARNLKSENVHLDKGYVDILQSKAHKDRRLFISDELVAYFKKYNAVIDKCFPNREYFSRRSWWHRFFNSSIF